LYDSKWSKNFQVCSQLVLKNKSKDTPPFWTFFHINVTLWSAAAQIFTGLKNGFLWIQMLISCNLHGGNFWNFFHIFPNQHNTRSYGYMCPKMFFKKKLTLVLEMAVLERFQWKHSQKPLGVNNLVTT